MAIAIMFSGQGAQQAGMGRSLVENSALARSLYDEAGAILGWSLSKVSFDGPPEALVQTKVCQPALFVHGYTVFRLLEEAARTADVSIALGLSLGEVTALTAAGVFDFATGLRAVAERGRLMQLACEQTSGAMASVIGEETEKVADLCREFDIEMANLNCPGQIVVSGEKAKVAAAIEAAKARGFRRVIPLNVAGAYHSRLMEPARAAFATFLESVEFRRPRFTVLANTTGKAAGEPAEIREALVRQIVSPVRWEACMREAAALGATEFFELGTGAILAGLARRTERSWPVKSFAEYRDLAS
ncbi:MAG: ACP S-malonyltransferase [Opitutaceae bacterium]